MAKKENNINIEDLFDQGLTKDQAKKIFNKAIQTVEDKGYQKNLTKMFTYASETGGDLFPKMSIKDKHSLLTQCDEYLNKWCKKYVNDRQNPALQRPLKNYGERDSALIERVATNTGMPKSTLNDYLIGHFIYMSAENMNGEILEEYLAEVLEPHGWIWCAGSTFRAVDFCYLEENNNILLQVKNKYNTENSSSSAIRNGTEIKKWNRLTSPKKATGLDRPLPNWKTLIELINAPDELAEMLSEEKYLEYIKNNSTKELDTLE